MKSFYARFLVVVLACFLSDMAAGQKSLEGVFLGRWEGCGEPPLVVQWKNGRLEASTTVKGRKIFTNQVVVSDGKVTIDFVVEKQVGRNYHVGDQGHPGMCAMPDEKIVRHLEFVGTIRGDTLAVVGQYYDEVYSHGSEDLIQYGRFLLCNNMKRVEYSN